MSTAILHAGSFIHDFNDIVMKVSFGIFIFYDRVVQKKTQRSPYDQLRQDNRSS